jgi:hypothetical protein
VDDFSRKKKNFCFPFPFLGFSQNNLQNSENLSPKKLRGDKHLQNAPGKTVSFFSPLKAYRASNQHALLTCLEMGGGRKRSTSFFPIVILKPLKYKEQLARRGHLSEIIIITMMLFEDTLLLLLVYLKSYTSIM